MEAIASMQKGDILTVWRQDRLGRSIRELVTTLDDLSLRGIEIRSLNENLDTTQPIGKLQFYIISALAEFERDLLKERTIAGLQAARDRGRVGGRRRKLDPELAKRLQELMIEKKYNTRQMCAMLDVGRTTLYRYVSPTGEMRVSF